MPSEYVLYYQNIGAAQESIIVNDWISRGPAPTHGPQIKVAGAALALGAAGLAIL